MTERDAFVRRICEEPFEDTHRLVFADWLAENGYEGWAYLVRQWGQPTVCPVSMSADVSFYPGPSAGTHYTVKLAEGRKGVQYVVRRGFVDEIRLPVTAFTEEFARDLFRSHPIGRVVLNDREPAEDRHADRPVEYLWRFRRHRWEGPTTVGPSAWDVPPFLAVEAFRGHGERGSTRRHRTRNGAFAALAAWCVAWGRELAGLPPLTPTEGEGET